MCLAKGHNAVPPLRLEPATLRSGVKQSTTEPLSLRSLNNRLEIKENFDQTARNQTCHFSYA